MKNAEREQTLGMRMDCVDMKSHRVPQQWAMYGGTSAFHVE